MIDKKNRFSSLSKPLKEQKKSCEKTDIRPFERKLCVCILITMVKEQFSIKSTIVNKLNWNIKFEDEEKSFGQQKWTKMAVKHADDRMVANRSKSSTEGKRTISRTESEELAKKRMTGKKTWAILKEKKISLKKRRRDANKTLKYRKYWEYVEEMENNWKSRTNIEKSLISNILIIRVEQEMRNGVIIIKVTLVHCEVTVSKSKCF